MAVALTSYHFCIAFAVSLIFSALALDENQFSFHGFNESNLHLDGMAKIDPHGSLLLINTSEIQIGHAFYPFPIKFSPSSCHSLSFSTNFSLGMSLGCQGIAFVISPPMDFSKAFAGGYLGLLNISNNGQPSNHILAVELDTVENPEFKDINGNHLGIDVNGLISIESATATYFSEEEGKNELILLGFGDPLPIWID